MPKCVQGNCHFEENYKLIKQTSRTELSRSKGSHVKAVMILFTTHFFQLKSTQKVLADEQTR